MQKEIICEVLKISKKYKDGSEEIIALHETSFKVSKGDFVAIIGPSGSGKSTLLTIIGGLSKPTTGDLIINNNYFYNLKDKKRSDLRFKEIGFILQNSNLVPYLKVSEQFKLQDKYSHKKINNEKLNKLIDELSIRNILNKYPSEISGGQRQRVAIGIALYKNPNLVLADEPTASLDTKTAYDVMEILKKLTLEENKATIMVTHDERMLKYCTRVFEIIDGQLKEKEHNKSEIKNNSEWPTNIAF